MELTTGDVLFCAPYVVSLTLSLGLAVWGLQFGKVPLAMPLAVYGLNQSAWTAGFLLKSFSVTLESKVIWDSLLFVPFFLLPFFLFLTSQVFAGKRLLPPSRTFWVLIGSITVFLTVVLTDQWTHWVYPDPRVVPGVPRGELAYTFTWAVYGMAILVYAVSLNVVRTLWRQSRSMAGNYRIQGYFLLAGLGVPMVGGLLTVAGVTIGPHRDIAPLTFGLGDLVIVWGMVRYRVRNLLPFAFETTFQFLEDPIVVTDLEGTIRGTNKAFAALCAVTSSALAGLPLRPPLPCPELAGDFYDVRSSSVRDLDGQEVGKIHIFRDIQALRNAQRQQLEDVFLRNQTLLQTAADGIHILDHDGYLIEANPAFCRLLGFTRDELLGRRADGWDREILGRMTDISPLIREAALWETQYLRKDGTLVDVEINGVGVEAEGTVFLYASARDITDRKVHEAEDERNQRLEALGILAGGIAHDFNNIMAGLKGHIEMALFEMEDREWDLTLARLKKTLPVFERGSALTRRLLTFSRGGSPVRGPAALGPLLEDWLEFALIGSEVTGVLQVDGDLWVCHCDSNQIGQAVSNLVINARQASKPGQAVTLKASNVLKDGPFVRIEVSDEGPGIPPEIKDKIFDPFFTTKAQGTGLGLAVTYSVVRQHRGWVDLETTAGRGSSFVIYLPASPQETLGAETPIRKEFHARGRAVVMDDEEDIRETVGDMLRKIGFEVLPARTAQETLGFYESSIRDGPPVQLFLLDKLIIGGPGGAEAAVQLREKGCTAPVIVMSGYFEPSVSLTKADESGILKLAKPFSLQDLSDLIGGHLG